MRRPWGWVALSLVMVLGLGACQKSGGVSAGGAPSGTGEVTATPSVSPEPAVTFSPESGATKVRPDQQVVVTAREGTLKSVEVSTAAGKVLKGELDEAANSWHSSGILATGAGYTVTAVASSEDGTEKTETSSFTTLKPTSTTGAVLIPGDDWTVGVGMPIMVEFARPVKNKDAALKALTVKTTPAVEGAWHWMHDKAAWWRPKVYWPSGTKVQLTAALDGVELSKGVWGKRTYTTRFTIGSSIISTVDVNKHTIRVVKDGKLVRELPVTTGLPTAKYRTRNGVKVIMDKKPVERMDAASTGTEKDDPEYYDLQVKWAMRLTWSGEYIHAAPWSVGSQGRANVSHGCTGMSLANAKWMYDFSKIGDVVVYKNSPRPLEPGNGYTVWDYTWEKWAGKAASSLSSSKGDSSASPSPSSTPDPSASATSIPHSRTTGPATSA